ncbi:MAG: hypothetical protein ACC628_06865 [Pirellulaceae bacterium]
MITVNDNTLLDYETQASHSITVRVTSSDSSINFGTMAITVGDVVESPSSSERELLDPPDETPSETDSDTPADEDDTDANEGTESSIEDQQQVPGSPVGNSHLVHSGTASEIAAASTVPSLSEEETAVITSDQPVDTAIARPRNRIASGGGHTIDTWYVYDSFAGLELHDQELSVGDLVAPDWNLYWDAIETIEEEAVQDRDVQVVVDTAAIVTTAASVTYALWSIRGASLVASMISSLPAWALIDPLPIVDKAANSRVASPAATDDDETLQDIVKRDESNTTKPFKHAPDP